MNQPVISLIAAISENRAIGNENKLLWNIPEDLKHFRSITSGHSVIMGRRTFESIGHPLPKRTNIIVTRDKKYKAEGCLVTHSIEEAIEMARKNIKQYSSSEPQANREVSLKEEVFIIGGGQIYEQAIKYADKLYLTVVKGNFKADTYFPDYAEFSTVISKQEGQSGNYHYTFLELEPLQGKVCKV